MYDRIFILKYMQTLNYVSKVSVLFSGLTLLQRDLPIHF